MVCGLIFDEAAWLSTAAHPTVNVSGNSLRNELLRVFQ
jgi:hypothetical protein